MELTYKRILLKISGEVLAGGKGMGIDYDTVLNICSAVKECVDMGVQVGLVVGGGNFWRGRQGADMDRTTADHMGMLATVINSLAMQDALEHAGVPTRVMTAIEMPRVAEPYILRRAIRHLEKGRVVIMACGTGNPYFSTDTGAALRAADIQADVLLQAKNIDGVYDSDPKKNPDARKYDKIGYLDVIKDGLQVMDTTAVSLCMENHIPIVTFALNEKDSIYKAATGQKIGTIIE